MTDTERELVCKLVVFLTGLFGTVGCRELLQLRSKVIEEAAQSRDEGLR